MDCVLMATLYYIMDPMCSWCYGFSHTMKTVVANLPANVPLRYIMGGLAPDSDEPMPEETQQYVQHAWKNVSDYTGAEFNYEFWEKCKPRRSTYPSCRAVIAAGVQDEAKIPAMIAAIQQAYYRQARNPSDDSTLIELAGEIGLGVDRFVGDLNSVHVEELLQADFTFKNRLGVTGFPALVLEKDDKWYAASMGYARPEVVMQRLEQILAL